MVAVEVRGGSSSDTFAVRRLRLVTVRLKGATVARILVCDDDPSVRQLLDVTLSFEHEVITASDGQEALDHLQGDPGVQLLVLDVMMPGRDGLSTLRELRAREATTHLPVILLTAMAQGSDAAEGLDAGGDEYLTKPFDPLELERLVDKYTADKETDPCV